MDINIKVRLESPELMAAILALAEALPKVNLGASISSVIEEKVEVKELSESGSNVESEKPKDAVKKEEAKPKSITLEEVRAVLAVKSQGGKQSVVKALIKEYGANKLTDVDPVNYKEIMEKVELL